MFFRKCEIWKKRTFFYLFFIRFKNVLFYFFYYKTQNALNLVVFCIFLTCLKCEKKLSFHFEEFCYVFQKVRKMEKKGRLFTFFHGIYKWGFFYYKTLNQLNLVVFFSFCDMPKMWKKNWVFILRCFVMFFRKCEKWKKRTFFYFFFMGFKNGVFYVFLLQNAKCTKFSRFLQFLWHA